MKGKELRSVKDRLKEDLHAAATHVRYSMPIMQRPAHDGAVTENELLRREEERAHLRSFANAVKEAAGEREIVAWGYNERMIRALEEAGLPSVGAVYTNDAATRDDIASSKIVGKPTELRGRSEEVFVVMPRAEGIQGAQRALESWGYRHGDYACLYPPSAVRFSSSGQIFEDKWGNIVDALPSNTQVSIAGFNNRIRFGAGVHVTTKLNITIRGSNNLVEIGAGARFLGESNTIRIWRGSGYSTVKIGENVRWFETATSLNESASLEIGAGTTFEARSRMYVGTWSRVAIGKDCMISTDAVFQSADGHSIFSTETGENVNSNLARRQGYFGQIELGDHVWGGRHALILGKTRIGQGSIVGAMGLVKGKFPNNCVLAGNPARLLRKNRAWARADCAQAIDSVGPYAGLTDEQDL